MRMSVADLMCETPVTVSPDCTADEALEAFFEYETPELYVVDKSGKLLGVLPDFEFIKTQLSGEARGACVEQLMSRSVPVFTVDSDASEVARLFRDGRYSRVPVVKAGRLVGVVTRADLLRLMAVLRRIDPPVATRSIEQKKPKILAGSRTGTTRTARSKSTPAKAARNVSRPKATTRRPKAAASRQR